MGLKTFLALIPFSIVFAAAHGSNSNSLHVTTQGSLSESYHRNVWFHTISSKVPLRTSRSIPFSTLSDPELSNILNSDNDRKITMFFKNLKNKVSFDDFMYLFTRFADKVTDLNIIEYVEDAPASFDPRNTHPHCFGIETVLDQGTCAAGWAFAFASTISHRTCMKDGSNFNIQNAATDIQKGISNYMSPSALLSCGNNYYGLGCSTSDDLSNKLNGLLIDALHKFASSAKIPSVEELPFTAACYMPNYSVNVLFDCKSMLSSGLKFFQIPCECDQVSSISQSYQGCPAGQDEYVRSDGEEMPKRRTFGVEFYYRIPDLISTQNVIKWVKHELSKNGPVIVEIDFARPDFDEGRTIYMMGPDPEMRISLNDHRFFSIIGYRENEYFLVKNSQGANHEDFGVMKIPMTLLANNVIMRSGFYFATPSTQVSSETVVPILQIKKAAMEFQNKFKMDYSMHEDLNTIIINPRFPSTIILSDSDYKKHVYKSINNKVVFTRHTTTLPIIKKKNYQIQNFFSFVGIENLGKITVRDRVLFPPTGYSCSNAERLFRTFMIAVLPKAYSINDHEVYFRSVQDLIKVSELEIYRGNWFYDKIHCLYLPGLASRYSFGEFNVNHFSSSLSIGGLLMLHLPTHSSTSPLELLNYLKHSVGSEVEYDPCLLTAFIVNSIRRERALHSKEGWYIPDLYKAFDIFERVNLPTQILAIKDALEFFTDLTARRIIVSTAVNIVKTFYDVQILKEHFSLNTIAKYAVNVHLVEKSLLSNIFANEQAKLLSQYNPFLCGDNGSTAIHDVIMALELMLTPGESPKCWLDLDSMHLDNLEYSDYLRRKFGLGIIDVTVEQNKDVNRDVLNPNSKCDRCAIVELYSNIRLNHKSRLTWKTTPHIYIVPSQIRTILTAYAVHVPDMKVKLRSLIDLSAGSETISYIKSSKYDYHTLISTSVTKRKTDNYFQSEVDPFSMKIADKVFMEFAPTDLDNYAVTRYNVGTMLDFLCLNPDITSKAWINVHNTLKRFDKPVSTAHCLAFAASVDRNGEHLIKVLSQIPDSLPDISYLTNSFDNSKIPFKSFPRMLLNRFTENTRWNILLPALKTKLMNNRIPENVDIVYSQLEGHSLIMPRGGRSSAEVREWLKRLLNKEDESAWEKQPLNVLSVPILKRSLVLNDSDYSEEDMLSDLNFVLDNLANKEKNKGIHISAILEPYWKSLIFVDYYFLRVDPQILIILDRLNAFSTIKSETNNLFFYLFFPNPMDIKDTTVIYEKLAQKFIPALMIGNFHMVTSIFYYLHAATNNVGKLIIDSHTNPSIDSDIAFFLENIAYFGIFQIADRSDFMDRSRIFENMIVILKLMTLSSDRVHLMPETSLGPRLDNFYKSKLQDYSYYQSLFANDFKLIEVDILAHIANSISMNQILKSTLNSILVSIYGATNSENYFLTLTRNEQLPLAILFSMLDQENVYQSFSPTNNLINNILRVDGQNGPPKSYDAQDINPIMKRYAAMHMSNMFTNTFDMKGFAPALVDGEIVLRSFVHANLNNIPKIIKYFSNRIDNVPYKNLLTAFKSKVTYSIFASNPNIDPIEFNNIKPQMRADILKEYFEKTKLKSYLHPK